jgi:AraC family transcriptional regulator
MELNHLAQTVGIHPVHLAREFRRFFQCTMGEYVRRLRVESACQEIIKAELPLSEIALKYGFYDQSHFTNIFKQLTGMTPAHYKSVFNS